MEQKYIRVGLLVLIIVGVVALASGKSGQSSNTSQTAAVVNAAGSTSSGGAVSIGVSSVSIPSDNFTSLPFSSLRWDSGNFGTVENGVFKFSKSGKYLLSAWTELEGNTPHAILPYQNGGGLLTHNTTGGDNTIILGLNVSAGDTISLSLMQSSGSPKMFTSYNITITNIDQAGGDTSGGNSVTVASGSSNGIFFSPDSHIWSDGKGTLTVAGAGNGSQSSLHLQVPDTSKYSLPTGTLAELTLARTSDQSWGGNYGRWSFSTFGSALNNVSGIYGEFGGNKTPTDFIFNFGYEYIPGMFNSFEPMRLMYNQGVGFGFGSEPKDIIQLIPKDPGSGQAYNSHSILWRAKSAAGTFDWRLLAQPVGSNSAFNLESKKHIPNADWISRLYIDDTGKVGIGTVSPSAQLDVNNPSGTGVVEIDGTTGGCLKVRDSDNAGWTYIKVFRGALQPSTTAC